MQLLLLTLVLPMMLLHGARLVMPISLTLESWNAGTLIEGINVRLPEEILGAKQTRCALGEVLSAWPAHV